MVASYVGENKEFERQYLSGELEVELNPQGTLAERIRAGGCGLGGFYTPTGVGTQIAQGKEVRTINGREYVLEAPLMADFAIVRAYRGDKWGNLIFRKTARNFSPLMCMAARVTIAEVEQLVEVGELDPDQIHVPSIFVQRVVPSRNYQKWIERRTVRKRSSAA
jgi:3-oxoacid CoA-transferase subunit A